MSFKARDHMAIKAAGTEVDVCIINRPTNCSFGLLDSLRDAQ